MIMANKTCIMELVVEMKRKPLYIYTTQLETLFV